MPSASFTALVDICRWSPTRHVAGTDLHAHLKVTGEVISALSLVEQGDLSVTVSVGGVEWNRSLSQLPLGSDAHVVVAGMVGVNAVVAQNVGYLLRYAMGRFLQVAPAEYFLLDENHASWEPSSHPDVLAYARALRVVSVVRSLQDASGPDNEAIIFATRKLVVPFLYDSAALVHVVDDSVIDDFSTHVATEQHREARRDIAKRAIIRFLDSVPLQDRFRELLRRLGEIDEAFAADFDIYASAFNFDKAREEFERKKLDFVVKTNSASADAMNKLIAIPVGQGLLASQMKAQPELHYVNNALLAGSLIFFAIGVAIILNQRSTLAQVRAELRLEKEVLYERSRPTYDRLKDMIRSLDDRLTLHIWAVPLSLSALLIVMTAITIYAYVSI